MSIYNMYVYIIIYIYIYIPIHKSDMLAPNSCDIFQSPTEAPYHQCVRPEIARGLEQKSSVLDQKVGLPNLDSAKLRIFCYHETCRILSNTYSNQHQIGI